MRYRFGILGADQHTMIFAEIDEPTKSFEGFLMMEFQNYSKYVGEFLNEVRSVMNGEQQSCYWGGESFSAFVTPKTTTVENDLEKCHAKKLVIPTQEFVEVLEKWRDFLANNSERDNG